MQLPINEVKKIAQSTLGPECACTLLKGGYKVHPHPAPCSTSVDEISRNNEGGNNQKEILFILGKAISGHPNIKGTKKLP